MDEQPPAKPDSGAFDDKAKELDKRLSQLVSDYLALYYRYPNSVAVLEKIQVLAALRVHPWRKKLAAIVASEINASFG